MRLTTKWIGGLLFASVLWGCSAAEPADKVEATADNPVQTTTAQQTPPPEQGAYADISLAAAAQRVPVIMYHDVIEKRTRGSVYFDVTTDELKAQLDWMKEQGIQPISLDQLYKHLITGSLIPDKAIVLTFDDNYQGFYDNAYPIFKERKIPSAMFVHTGFVGDTTHGRPKMSWDTLKTLVKEGLVTIGSHTITHPADITMIPVSEQDKELTESKKTLEDQLGIHVDYLAYPDGKNDAIVQDAAKRAGYKMAFSTSFGPAEESPNIFSVDRYISTKLEQAWEDKENADQAPAAFVMADIANSKISYEFKKVNGIDMAFIRGGFPSTFRSPARQQVSEFMTETNAQAGINGTFFAMAAIQGTSNEMVGPVFAENENTWVPDTVADRVLKIKNRPLVAWNAKSIVFVTFPGEQMNKPDAVEAMLPGVKSAFVAGGWLVHNGKALTRDQMQLFGAGDMMEFRHRVFFGIDNQNQIVMGASLGSIGADVLAECAAAEGVKEAIMLDCGFSTSLVYGDKQIASGHSTPEQPSRPVPHAILLKGELAQDPNTITVPQPVFEGTTRRKRRRHAQPKPNPDDTTSATPDAAPDSNPNP